MDRSVDLSPALELVTDRGRLSIREVAPGVVLTVFAGHGSMEVAEALIEYFERMIERYGSIAIFDDWEAAQGYDSEVRICLTDWTKRHFDSLRTTTVLVRSKILAMGLSVANLALRRPVTVTNDRKSFERALMLARSEARSRLRASPPAV
jgi:hypothetical protein